MVMRSKVLSLGRFRDLLLQSYVLILVKLEGKTSLDLIKPDQTRKMFDKL